MPRPFAITSIAVIAALLTGCAGGADHPSFTQPTASPDPEPGQWTAWAEGLGFDPADDTPPPADPVVLQNALDALSDDDLASWNDELRAGSAMTMRLASWLWRAAGADQVARLHDLMPRLEPRVAAGASWSPGDVAVPVSPALDDIHQGGADDCWLMAGFGAVARTDPAALTRIATRNDNGTWTVAWTVDGEEVPVTVSPYLPSDGSGDLLYAHDASWTTPNWTSMFEKAHAALPRFGSYGRLAGGSMVADTPVTVAAAMASVLGAPSETAPAREVALQRLLDALAEGRPVAATTFLAGLAPEPGDGEVRLIDRHVYVVDGVDHDGRIVLHNPWGVSGPAGPEVVRVTIDQFQRRFLLVTFGAPAGR